MTTITDLTVTGADGAPVALEQWRGQVLLIVNTASKCGFTPQYEGLEALHRRYADRGFAVLGFPCNQFGAQEPGDAARKVLRAVDRGRKVYNFPWQLAALTHVLKRLPDWCIARLLPRKTDGRSQSPS